MIIQRVQRGIVSGSINITAQEIEGFLATEEAIAQLTPELLVRQIQVSSLEAAETILLRLEEINHRVASCLGGQLMKCLQFSLMQ